jgi:hypothetical protein
MPPQSDKKIEGLFQIPKGIMCDQHCNFEICNTVSRWVYSSMPDLLWKCISHLLPTILFVRGQLHGEFWMCVFMSDKPFVAEACPPMSHASASNGLSDIETHIENAPCNRPLKRTFIYLYIPEWVRRAISARQTGLRAQRTS